MNSFEKGEGVGSLGEPKASVSFSDKLSSNSEVSVPEGEKNLMKLSYGKQVNKDESSDFGSFKSKPTTDCSCCKKELSASHYSSSCSKQCFSHNNNVVDRNNVNEEKSCCSYINYPLKVNNNVYPEKRLAAKDGMEEYFKQFTSAASNGIPALIGVSPSNHQNSCSECLDSAPVEYDQMVNGSSLYSEANQPNADEIDEDDSCIYTYKGDNYDSNFSHLMQTCFSCGLPTMEVETSKKQNGTLSIQRILNGSTHSSLNAQNNIYSPEMDFLEMDFDPGSNGDGADTDSEDNNVPDTSYDEDDPLVNYTKPQSKSSHSNNIPNDIRSLLCRRCQTSVFTEENISNSISLSPKHNLSTTYTNNEQYKFDDRPKDASSSDFSVNIPLPTQATEENHSDGDINEALEFEDEDISEGEDADDEGGEDSLVENTPCPNGVPTSSSIANGLSTCGNSNSDNHVRCVNTNNFSVPDQSSLDHIDEGCSDNLIKIMLKNIKFNGRLNAENNNLGSVSAPEVSPTKEYTPLENFSRSISLHNQLSSPKYENVCFIHPCKNNPLPSVSNCSSVYRDNQNSKHNCDHSSSEGTSNLEACVDRLNQRERSVFNIISNPVQHKGQVHSCCSSTTTPHSSSNTSEVHSRLSAEPSNAALEPLLLKVMQPSTSDPLRDSSTLPEEDPEPNSACQNNDVEKVMVWTERQATFRQVSQIGTSACGPTAVINVLLALGHSKPVKEVTTAIRTRLRADSGSLVRYLLSRSNAGTTHEDLIQGVREVSEGAVYGKFFHMFPRRDFHLSKWLAEWIKKGGVPVATLNLQVGVSPGQTMPDAWHHQMVFGVGPQGVYLTNPLECVSDSLLSDQLCSDSVLLVRRSDVTSRWDHSDQLIQLSLQSDPRWNEMNVLGQIVCILKEDASPDPDTLQGRRHLTSHVVIPASYNSGVSIFVRSDNLDCLNELRDAPELPLME